MRLFRRLSRWARKLRSSPLELVVVAALGLTPALCHGQSSERIQASYVQGNVVVSVTLIIDGYTTPSGLQALSQAFEEGQDQGLVAALAKAKAVGNCSITGEPSFHVAFIQMAVTPTGRQITFITNRPLRSDEVQPGNDAGSFDLMVGQFDINDTDNTLSTGFLYPASRLVTDEQGRIHYDLAGSPWSLVNFQDMKQAPASASSPALKTIS
jgi:hypothetical protein